MHRQGWSPYLGRKQVRSNGSTRAGGENINRRRPVAKISLGRGLKNDLRFLELGKHGVFVYTNPRFLP